MDFPVFTLLLSFITLAKGNTCNQSCEKTHSLHTSDQVGGYYACLRGCRFSRLDQFLHRSYGEAEISSGCSKDCELAYGADHNLSASCQVGCKSQIQFQQPVHSTLEDDSWFHGHLPVFRLMRWPLADCWKKMSSQASSFMKKTVYFNDGKAVIWSWHSTGNEPQREEVAEDTPVKITIDPVKQATSHFSWIHHRCQYLMRCSRANSTDPRCVDARWMFLVIMLFSSFFLLAVWWSLAGARKRNNQRHNFSKEFTVDAQEAEVKPLPPKYALVDEKSAPPEYNENEVPAALPEKKKPIDV